MKPILLVCWLALVLLSARADQWTIADSLAEVGCVGLLMLDWSQSLDHRFRESNTVLPAEPNRQAVSTYFLSVISVQLLVARLLPNPWRRISQMVVIGVETHSVARNWQLGADLSW
jgi:hypothetical protein